MPEQPNVLPATTGGPMAALWRALDSEPRLAIELAVRAGVDHRSAGQRLARLVREGLAVVAGEEQDTYRRLYRATAKRPPA